jgi:hypothetical protein
MLVVESIAKIRRAFFVQGKAIKAICRDLGVSRKVVRKVIRLGATEFRYQREDQPLPKIDRWRDILDELLLANEAKASRERLTLIRIFEELRGRGYDASYDAVRRYAKRWGQGSRPCDGHGVCAAEFCSRGSLSVRLEPRDRRANLTSSWPVGIGARRLGLPPLCC